MENKKVALATKAVRSGRGCSHGHKAKATVSPPTETKDAASSSTKTNKPNDEPADAFTLSIEYIKPFNEAHQQGRDPVVPEIIQCTL